ncbi:MAG: hypothetical protein D6805_00465 [Planctomycetota bacterium]|nr:MAG: hypothetical protein D6805_00465 [Planctomycetota bacterium]
MKTIFLIAKNTFKETIRNKILYTILFFGILIIALSRLLADVSAGENEKIIQDVGISSISFFATLICILAGINLVYNEIDRRTIYTILSKPVKRYQFLLGKYLGLSFSLLMIVLAMTAIFVLYLLWNQIHPHPAIFQAIFLEFMTILLIAAFAILFSSITTPLLSAIFTVFLYIVGNTLYTVKLAEQQAILQKGWIQTIFKTLYHFLPNLHNFNMKVYASHKMMMPLPDFLSAIAYGIVYTTLVLILAIAIFHSRNF